MNQRKQGITEEYSAGRRDQYEYDMNLVEEAIRKSRSFKDFISVLREDLQKQDRDVIRDWHLSGKVN